EPVAGVLLPVDVRSELGHAAEALFAFPYASFGPRPAHELSDLAADDAYRFDQPFFGLAPFAAVERQHADHFSLGGHGKGECAAQSVLLRRPHRPWILRDVGYPYGGARPQHLAGETLSRRQREPAGRVDE